MVKAESNTATGLTVVSKMIVHHRLTDLGRLNDPEGCHS
jgi:hypothetical protein